MNELLEEFKRLKIKISNKEISIEQSIVEYSLLLGKFNEKRKNNTRLDTALMSDKNVLSLIKKNEDAEKHIKKLQKIVLLKQLGFDFTEKEIQFLIENNK